MRTRAGVSLRRPEEFRAVLSQLQLDESAAADFRDYYNSAMDQYDNAIYERIETRTAHWLNFVEGGWFQQRLTPFLELAGAYDVVVDLGFSIPYPYTVADSTSRYRGTRFLFVDRCESALRFYESFTAAWTHSGTRRSDRVILADIESTSGHAEVVEAARKLKPRSMLVVMSEVVEHLRDPSAAWKLAAELEALASERNSVTYVTLPVGQRIPSHVQEFRSAAAARDFAKAGVDILLESVLSPYEGDTSVPYLRECYCCLGRAKGPAPQLQARSD